MTYEEAERVAEIALFDWYVACPGDHDMLSAEALEALQKCIASSIFANG